MSRDDLIKLLARDLCRANGIEPDALLHDDDVEEWTFYVSDALAVLATISAADLVIVPKNPSVIGISYESGVDLFDLDLLDLAREPAP